MFRNAIRGFILSSLFIFTNCYAQEENIFSDEFIEKINATYEKLEGTENSKDQVVKFAFLPIAASFIKETFESVNLLNREMPKKDWEIENINLELSSEPKVIVTLKKK